MLDFSFAPDILLSGSLANRIRSELLIAEKTMESWTYCARKICAVLELEALSPSIDKRSRGKSTIYRQTKRCPDRSD